MAIRINLLAEQQEAEELRRKDPVKWSLYVGAAIILIVIAWSIWVQLGVGSARAQLREKELEYNRREPEFLVASNAVAETREMEFRLDALERYRTNRFFWSPALSALQFATAEQVRLVEIKAGQKFDVDLRKVETTRSPLRVNLPEKSWWQWWTDPPATNIHDLVNEFFGTATNKIERSLHSVMTMSATIKTNPTSIQAQVLVVKPDTITERASLTLQGRDYSRSGASYGIQYTNYFAAMTNLPYFSQHLNRTNAFVRQDSVTPKLDAKDPANRTRMYIPFTIEYHFPPKTEVE